MSILQSFILGALQGLTEFLPVSSSGHLVLAEHLFQLDVSSLLSFDIIVHTGTLLALVFYFWRTWTQIVTEIFKKGKWLDKMITKLIVATIPAVIFALLFKDSIESTFRGVQPVLIALVITAALLFLGEKFGKKRSEEITYTQVIIMGLLQALAVIPGISRSGSTITGGLFSGLKRETAARFAFLMAVPAIGGAFVFALKESLQGGMALPQSPIALTGFLSSFFVSLLCIHYFLKFVRKYPLYIFSIYLVVVAGLTLLLNM
jgi:undecaprenyl-diphosphatase